MRPAESVQKWQPSRPDLAAGRAVRSNLRCLGFAEQGKRDRRHDNMSDYPRVERFESVSIILPVINETTSLRQTVEIILRDVKRELIKELVIVVCQKTTAESMATIEQLQKELGELVVILHQRLPFLGGALRDAIDLARGSHLLIMGSDLETNPNEVHLLIAAEQKNPAGIVATSRWIRGGSFHGYSRIKLICNWIFQRFFSLLYLTHLTDMTYGFRFMPTRLAQAIPWEELRHPFNLESIVKPLRLGVPATELPSVWHPRIEGESQNPFFRNFEYFRIGLKVRFARKKSFLRPAAAAAR
jgi:glycosyltransferase involved in cell wall biosynthesis